MLGKDVTFSLRTEGVKNASYQNLCDHEVIPAMHCSGGWAQYITVTAADLNCIRLPEGVDTLSAAALGCRYMTGYRAVVHQGRVQPGQWVAMHGCGGVGLSAVQIAAAMDAMVVAVDVFNNKSPEKVGQAVRDATGGGVHVSIDVLGRAFTVLQSIQRAADARRRTSSLAASWVG